VFLLLKRLTIERDGKATTAAWSRSGKSAIGAYRISMAARSFSALRV